MARTLSTAHSAFGDFLRETGRKLQPSGWYLRTQFHCGNRNWNNEIAKPRMVDELLRTSSMSICGSTENDETSVPCLYTEYSDFRFPLVKYFRYFTNHKTIIIPAFYIW